jgi:hypothetical protein
MESLLEGPHGKDVGKQAAQDTNILGIKGRISLWIIVQICLYFESRACHLLHADFVLGLLFDPAAGGDMFSRNVC